jgi:hypothetical protein
MRKKEVLWRSLRQFLGWRKLGTVGIRWALAKVANNGEKWSPGVVSRRIDLDSVAAPSADEGGAVHQLRRRREASQRSTMMSKAMVTERRARVESMHKDVKLAVGTLPCVHVRRYIATMA